MRFGGHETFAIREGWLHKGLKLLTERPELLLDENACDHLGVGRNMAKSIRHWLVAAGLARPCHDFKIGKKSSLTTTDFGDLVWRRDRYFTEPGTWWAVHVNLVNSAEHALTWTWFFGSFNFDRFDRAVCLEGLRRNLELSKQRMPNPRTLERDVACLLASYARVIPAPDDDPEEGSDCPLRELGLLSYFKTSGYYQTHQHRKDVPAELFGYALATAFRDAAAGSGKTDITLLDAARAPGGPGRAFVLTTESLYEVATQAESNLGGELEIVGLAGARALRITTRPPLDWLKAHYQRLEKKDRHRKRRMQNLPSSKGCSHGDDDQCESVSDRSGSHVLSLAR
jgi:hypothetical protein